MVSSWERALQQGDGQAAAAKRRAALRAQAQARTNWSNTVRMADEAKRDAAAAAEANRRMPVQNLFEEPAPPPTPMEMFVGRQEQAQRQAQNAPIWNMMLYGEQKESALPGRQEAGKLESFLRTQAGEDEFRLAGRRAQEGRLGAAAGWGLLGLAGAVPFFGDIAQSAAGVSRAARSAGSAADVAQKSDRVTAGVSRFAQPLIQQGRIAPQRGVFLEKTIEDTRSKVKNAFSLEPTDGRGMPDPRDPSDALAIFDEIIDEYSSGFVGNNMAQTGSYVPDFNAPRGINNAISDEIISEISRRLGRKPWGAGAPVTPKFAKQFADAISDLDLTVSTDLNGLAGLASSGRYASGFETGITSSGSWWPGFRSRSERSMFDIPEDAPASSRPVYGFLSHRPGATPKVPDELPGMARSVSPNAAYQYGEIRLRFGRSATDRSTMTAGDSIRGQFTPVPISDPSLDNIAVGNMNRVNGNTYIETQTPGGLRFDELIGIDVPEEMVQQVRAIVGDDIPIFPY